MLCSNQGKVIKQAKLAYSPLGKPLEKQTKKIKYHGERKIEKQLKIMENN